ncbi:MAG: aminotransferase class V-fold PLP-dependent enzyme [Thermomicrobiales bacterium]
MIYLDNAATSWPKPPSVGETLAAFLAVAGANPGRGSHRMAREAALAIAETRSRLAVMLGAADPDRVIFTGSATEAINLAILGMSRPGDRIVSTGMGHNAVRRPLAVVAGRGVEVVTLTLGPDVDIDEDRLASAMRGACLVVMTHASNVNGAIQPVSRVARLAHAAGALLLLDASQTAGAIPFDMEMLGADLVAVPGHKGLMGPPGTGALVIGHRVDPARLDPLLTGGTGFRSEDDAPPAELPYRYEAGTLNTVGIAALGAGLAYLEDRGVASIAAHEAGLTTRLVAGLAAIPGVTVLAAGDPARQAAVVSFVARGWSPQEVAMVLDQSFDIACRAGLHCAPEACRALGVFPAGTVRFSPGPFSTAEEIDTAIAAVATIATAPVLTATSATPAPFAGQ